MICQKQYILNGNKNQVFLTKTELNIVKLDKILIKSLSGELVFIILISKLPQKFEFTIPGPHAD